VHDRAARPRQAGIARQAGQAVALAIDLVHGFTRAG